MRYKFGDKYGYGKPYVFIHPHKQSIVKHIVDSMPDWVDYAIVFGSSVQPYCKPASDVDICIIGAYKKGIHCIDLWDIEDVDIIHHNSKEDFLSSLKDNPHSATSEAYNKGVVVYAKG